MFKLLIVDDEILIRKGLSETIDWASIDVQIVGEATNGVEGLEMVASLKPDIIISDIRMPIMDGIAMAKELQNNNFDGIVIILSGYSEFTYAQQAITSDIVAYMLKPTDNEMLLKTVVESSRKLATRRAKNRIIKMYQDDAVLLKGKTLNDFLNATLSAAEIADRFSLYGLKPIMYGYIVEGLYTPDSSIDQDVRVALSELYDMVISLFNDATLLGSFYNTGFKLITDRDCAEVAIKNEIENVLLKYSKIYDVPIGIAISSRFKYPDNVVALHKNVQMQLMNRPFKFVNTVTTAENFHQPYCKLVTKTMSIIAREYTGNISIPRIAERLLISPSHLMHVFKENVGRTVNDYITEFRLLKAKHILKHEPYRNIGDVAQMVGYSDEKYFGQVFKKHTGMTPGEFSLK